MSNPFNESFNNGFTGEGFFSDFIMSQLSPIQIDEAKQIDLCGVNLATGRATIQHVAGKMGTKYKTRMTRTGEFWIKRIQ